ARGGGGIGRTQADRRFRQGAGLVSGGRVAASPGKQKTIKTSSFPRRRESSGFIRKVFLNYWIPAFAGMTRKSE
ncbi:MAG: hypothetical protein K2P67_09175, partial [Gallionellaceae bacterium]|nr:hypothetical protein [Gallionellaceae bacterium]